MPVMVLFAATIKPVRYSAKCRRCGSQEHRSLNSFTAPRPTCDPQRRHFAEYLTGLMVAANKTITGINGEFVETTDQSCLNRFLTEVAWDEQALNERRLELLQR